jgi:sugar phosphate isomerase/epimerase
MPRPVLLMSNSWAHLPLEELVQKLNDWGYQGLELCCVGDHFEVQRAQADDAYCQEMLDLLARYDLQVLVLSNYRVGQAICDRIEPRHKEVLPDYVWGDGDPVGVQDRAAAEMLATISAAQKLGVGVVSGFSGSSLWPGVVGWPANNPVEVQDGLRDFARRFTPILDACADAGVRFALEVHPGQVAFDLYSAEMVLDVLDGREEFGFTFDPSHLHWQGIDPAEFLRRFPERIYHVHVKDLALTLNGRSGVLNSYQPYGDPRRGWEFRSPGHGAIDWESIVRALHAIRYEGPLAVEWSDPSMDPEYGAEEACKFVKRLDFPAKA